jgi:hypothetical protein
MATGKSNAATRQKHDFYPTPHWAIDMIFAEFAPAAMVPGAFSWAESAAGDFRIYDRMPEPKDWAEIQKGRDYFAKPYPADIAITNPPFGISLEFATKALAECGTVVLFLQLDWLGSQDRKDFWQKNPPTHLFPLSRRPSFTGEVVTATIVDLFETEVELFGDGGSASVNYAWYCWDRLGVMRRRPGVYVL